MPAGSPAVQRASAADHGEDGVQWGLAVVLVLTVVGYAMIAGLPVITGLPNRLISVPYRAFVLVLSIVVFARAIAADRIYRGALWMPLLVFWLLYFGRMLMDTVIAPVPLGQPPVEYFLYGIGTCFVPMLALLTRPNWKTADMALRMLTFAGAYAALVAVALGVRILISGDITNALASGRFEIWTLDSISLGHVGVTTATLALFQLRTLAGRGRFEVVALTAAAGIGLVTAAVAASKGPLLALTATVGLLLLLQWREGRRVRAFLGLVIFPFLGLQGAIYVEDVLGFGVISRFESALEGDASGSVSTRLDLQRSAGEQFLENPALGSSLDERNSLTYPHNTIVESFMAVGIVGGIAYLMFHLMALWRGYGIFSTRPEVAWVSILCVQYSISAMFSGSLYTSNALWGLLAASIATADSMRVPSPLAHAPVRRLAASR